MQDHKQRHINTSKYIILTQTQKQVKAMQTNTQMGRNVAIIKGMIPFLEAH